MPIDIAQILSMMHGSKPRISGRRRPRRHTYSRRPRRHRLRHLGYRVKRHFRRGRAHLVKGSEAARRHMARIRGMRRRY